jgi:hypothetical protein
MARKSKNPRQAGKKLPSAGTVPEADETLDAVLKEIDAQYSVSLEELEAARSPAISQFIGHYLQLSDEDRGRAMRRLLRMEGTDPRSDAFAAIADFWSARGEHVLEKLRACHLELEALRRDEPTRLAHVQEAFTRWREAEERSGRGPTTRRERTLQRNRIIDGLLAQDMDWPNIYAHLHEHYLELILVNRKKSDRVSLRSIQIAYDVYLRTR